MFDSSRQLALCASSVFSSFFCRGCSGRGWTRFSRRCLMGAKIPCCLSKYSRSHSAVCSSASFYLRYPLLISKPQPRSCPPQRSFLSLSPLSLHEEGKHSPPPNCHSLKDEEDGPFTDFPVSSRNNSQSRTHTLPPPFPPPTSSQAPTPTTPKCSKSQAFRRVIPRSTPPARLTTPNSSTAHILSVSHPTNPQSPGPPHTIPGTVFQGHSAVFLSDKALPVDSPLHPTSAASITPPAVSQALSRVLSITSYSGVQNFCIPQIASGVDTFITAYPGSGKTLCYLIPLVIRGVEAKRREVQLNEPENRVVRAYDELLGEEGEIGEGGGGFGGKNSVGRGVFLGENLLEDEVKALPSSENSIDEVKALPSSKNSIDEGKALPSPKPPLEDSRKPTSSLKPAPFQAYPPSFHAETRFFPSEKASLSPFSPAEKSSSPIHEQLSNPSTEGNIFALVLCPTKDLALQISLLCQKVIRYLPERLRCSILTSFTPSLGLKMSSFDSSVGLNSADRSGGYDALDSAFSSNILIATPGLLADLCDEDEAKMRRLFRNSNFLVVEEASNMLQGRLFRQLLKIQQVLPPQHQTVMVSSLVDDLTRRLAIRQFMRVNGKCVTIFDPESYTLECAKVERNRMRKDSPAVSKMGFGERVEGCVENPVSLAFEDDQFVGENGSSNAFESLEGKYEGRTVERVEDSSFSSLSASSSSTFSSTTSTYSASSSSTSSAPSPPCVWDEKVGSSKLLTISSLSQPTALLLPPKKFNYKNFWGPIRSSEFLKSIGYFCSDPESGSPRAYEEGLAASQLIVSHSEDPGRESHTQCSQSEERERIESLSTDAIVSSSDSCSHTQSKTLIASIREEFLGVKCEEHEGLNGKDVLSVEGGGVDYGEKPSTSSAKLFGLSLRASFEKPCSTPPSSPPTKSIRTPPPTPPLRRYSIGLNHPPTRGNLLQEYIIYPPHRFLEVLLNSIIAVGLRGVGEGSDEGRMSNRKVIVFFPTKRVLQFYYVFFKYYIVPRYHSLKQVNWQCEDVFRNVRTPVESRQKAEEIAGMKMLALHSAVAFETRSAIIEKFNALKNCVLFTTDIVSSGIDFAGVSLVVQVGVSETPIEYLQRTGRTGRNGFAGHSLLLLHDLEGHFLREIYHYNMPIHPVNAHTAAELLSEVPALKSVLSSAREGNIDIDSWYKVWYSLKPPSTPQWYDEDTMSKEKPPLPSSSLRDPGLQASFELMYRSYLGFYCQRASRLKFERWQVPSLVKDLISFCGVQDDLKVSKELAARLGIIGAPGLIVYYEANKKTALMASLAALPGFISRYKQTINSKASSSIKEEDNANFKANESKEL